jgi:hypothetical protein
VFERTGQWDWGDTSEHIRKGRIERARPQHAEIVLPEAIVEKATRCYNESIEALVRKAEKLKS